MPELMEALETIRAEEASVHRLFDSERGEAAVGRRNRRDNPQYIAKLAEAAKLLQDVKTGKLGEHYLREAMTTSDFPLLFGDIIDRQLLAGYREFPTSYQDWVKINPNVKDFRTVRRFTIDGGQGRLQKVGTVPEETEYPYEALTEGKFDYSVLKYGKKFRYSWETFIDDDLGALDDSPLRQGVSARRTEEYYATDLFFDANGPDATFFSSGHHNIITANPALTIAGLQTAFAILAAQTDVDGEPIMIDAVTLVIPPALQVIAQNIMNATQIWSTAAASGGVAGEQINTENWMRSKVKLSIAPYIPLIAASSNTNTSWMLVADPNSGRPAAEIGFLRGHREPELFQKTSNAVRVGGGPTDPTDGDFDSDSIEYKVRHVLGGTLMDYRMAVASNGSGS